MRIAEFVFAATAVIAAAAPAWADDDFEGGTIIFARGTSLLRVDAKGKGETEVATLPEKTVVRALRTDAAGTILLADLGGKWSWMPLDDSTKTLTELPCAEGPAQIADDASCVLCRSTKDPKQAVLFNFAKAKAFPLAIGSAGARLAIGTGTGTDGGRKLVWADADGVWTATPGKLADKTKVAPDAPLRGFLASPDGTRGVGVYSDEVYTDVKHKKTADILMGFQLDGTGARRKAIRDGVAIDWTHDSQYILIQNGAQGCEMRATGGEYKCFAGFTVESAASDGRWMVLLGARDPKTKAPAPTKTETKTDASGDADPDAAPADVAVALPTGPLALYRGRLEGLLTEQPTQIVKVVDGAAVWVPKKAVIGP